MYVTFGIRSKWCGHEHENRTDAEKCLLEHHKECRKNNKVSDRQVLEVDSIDDLEDSVRAY